MTSIIFRPWLKLSIWQDEQKKIEDSERRSREDFSDRTEALFWEVNDTMEQAQNPESQKGNVEQDELYASQFFNVSIKIV